MRKAPGIRRRILLGLVFLTPLFFLRTAYDVFNVPKLWLLMVGVTIVAAIRCVELLQSNDRAGLDLLLVPATAVAGSLMIGTVASPYRVWALVGDHSRFTGLVPYLVVIAMGVLIADAFRGDPRPLAWALVGSAAVAGAYALIQVLGLDPIEWSATQQATVTIGNTNFSGAFFAICLPVSVGLWLMEDRLKVQSSVVTALVFAGLVVARSELAWTAGAAGVLVMSGVFLSERWRFARIVGLVAASAIALAGVVMVLLGLTNRAPAFVPDTIERRAEWWDASVAMAAESPFLGQGPNSFAIEHTQHRDLDDVVAVGFDVTDDPHSVPLSFLIAAGVFGISGFVLFVGWIVLRVLRAEPRQRMGAAFAGAAIAYLVQSLLSVDVVTLRFAAWVSVGGMAAAFAPLPSAGPKPHRGKKKKARQQPEPLRALPGVVAIILVAGGAIAWAWGFLSADIGFRQGLLLAAAGAPGAKENLESAVDFRENNYTYRANYGRLLGGNAVQEGLADNEQVAQQLIAEAKEAFGFIERLPHANSVVTYARVTRDWAQVDEAAEDEALALYGRAHDLDPFNYLILEEQAAAADSFGRTELAAELAAEAEVLRAAAES